MLRRKWCRWWIRGLRNVEIVTSQTFHVWMLVVCRLVTTLACDDCVIDRQVVNPIYIAFEIQNCVDNGTTVVATGDADPIYFDLIFSNISKVNMSNFKWMNDGSVYLLPTNSTCPSNATFGSIWFYNFYLLIGGVTMNVPKCNYAVLSFSNLTSQIFTHATRGGEPFLTLNMTSSQTSVVTFALYNTPILNTLIVQGVSGAGNLNFKGGPRPLPTNFAFRETVPGSRTPRHGAARPGIPQVCDPPAGHKEPRGFPKFGGLWFAGFHPVKPRRPHRPENQSAP